jgi:hypothetical protein
MEECIDLCPARTLPDRAARSVAAFVLDLVCLAHGYIWLARNAQRQYEYLLLMFGNLT